MTEPNPYSPPTASVAEPMAPVQLARATPAGFWIRTGAFMLDLLPLYALHFVSMRYQWVSAATSLAFPVYKIWMESEHGATLGKMLLGIRVVDRAGRLPRFTQAVLRNLPHLLSAALSLVAWGLWQLGPLSSQPIDPAHPPLASFWLNALSVVILVDVLPVLGDARKRAMHDSLAGTYCVRAPRGWRSGTFRSAGS